MRTELKGDVFCSCETITDEAERLPSYPEPIDYDSVARERPRHQPDSQDIASADRLGRAAAVVGADPDNGQVRGRQCRAIAVDSTRQVYRDHQRVGEHHNQ